MADKMDREMQRALEADGEKLRQLTGEDHGPYFISEALECWATCDKCEGSGVETFGITVYEHGCGFSHDSTDERPCPRCGGAGGWIGEVPHDG